MTDREFENLYTEELKKSADLPGDWSERYQLFACLKDSPEKKTYLVKGLKKEEKYILKWAAGKEASHLLAEGEICQKLQKTETYDIDIKEMIQDENSVWLLRNYVEGNSLAEIGEARSFSEDEICHMGILICKSVENLHRRKPPVIHRDIKPENIIVKGDGSIALIDLETARSYKEGKSEDTYFAGTRETAAPEQYGFGQSDERTDIYGIGKTLLYMQTGDYVLEDLEKGAGGRRLKRIIRKCCAFDPKRRFATAKEVSLALQKCLPGEGKEGRRVKGLTGLVALLTVLVLALSVQVLLLKQEVGGVLPKAKPVKNQVNGSPEASEPGSEPGGADQVIIRGWNMTDYEVLLDQILDSIDEKDYQLMAEQCRQLISALYEDPFLQAVEAEDTYYYEENDVRWEGYNIVRAGYEHVADDLAYHDRMLEQELASFDQYKYHIAALIRGNMEYTRMGGDGNLVYSTLYYYRVQKNTDDLDGSLGSLLEAIIDAIELYHQENNIQ